jgi:hypothetical protein
MPDDRPEHKRFSEPTLDELATRIKTEHSAIAEHMRGKGLVEKAINLGRALNQAKAKVEHSKWLDWLKQNCELKERTAQRYMRLDEHRAKIDAHCKEKSVTVTDLTLNKAFELTAAPKPQEENNNSDTKQDDTTNPDPVKLSDEIDGLVDALITKLKVLKADNKDNAEAAASDLVEKLELLDLLPVALKKAA